MQERRGVSVDELGSLVAGEEEGREEGEEGF